jgi:hypothetical protein
MRARAVGSAAAGDAPPGGMPCPDEPTHPAAVYLKSECGATCQAETRAALIAMNDALMWHSGCDWSNDTNSSGEALPYTTQTCNAPAAADGEAKGYCTVQESIDLLPGDPNAFLMGVKWDSWLPSYCCWRGVVCCSSPNMTVLHGPCQPFSVIGLLFKLWPGELRGSLDAVLDPLPRLGGDSVLGVLDRWGLQRLEISSNSLTGTLPPSITKLHSIFSLMLGDNCGCPCCPCGLVWSPVCAPCVHVRICFCGPARRLHAPWGCFAMCGGACPILAC